MDKYRASKYRLAIKKVSVKRETAKFYIFDHKWLGETRESKIAHHWQYFDTWSEAHQFIIKHAEVELQQAKNTVDYRRSRLEEVRKMKEE